MLFFSRHFYMSFFEEKGTFDFKISFNIVLFKDDISINFIKK